MSKQKNHDGYGGGGQVIRDHSDQSSRSNFPSPSKIPSENECEIPCEGDLLVVRRMLGTTPNLWMKLKEKIFSTPTTLSTKSYAP